ncbi:hypothetical protein HPB48_022348 [Haemaphysalis longicornis]|uniref:Major facilitator superfamily (MFS) profile domain-containing protein n=1 Tax=Haemaphysalis longicornis TaxID=44386 RepID=A0A9J6GGT3_HAELO|nr:hypothetical protein HPB48_022348 [Haemaphysalis longicornis]
MSTSARSRDLEAAPAQKADQPRRAQESTTGRTMGSMSIVTQVDLSQAQHGINAIGHGDFQKFILCFTITAHMALLCHSNALALITDPVDHWCRPPPEFAEMAAAQWKNVGIPVDASGGYSQCLAYAHNGSGLNDSETTPCNEWDYDEEAASRSARSHWDLVCHRAWLLSLGKGVFMSGTLLVTPAMGYLADTKGRQPVIVGASYVLVLCTLASCFAEVYPIYVALTFVNSACASTIHIVTVILLFEVAPPEYRTFYSGLGSSVGVLLAELFLTLVSTTRTSWQVRQLIVVSPTILLLSVTFIVYESPLWLLTMYKLKEAEEIMNMAATMNRTPRIRTQRAVHRIKHAMRKVSIPYLAASPAALMLHGTLRLRAAGIFATTYAIMLAYYSLVWSDRLSGGRNLLLRIASALLLGPAYLFMYVALSRMGRLQFMLVLFALVGGATGLYAVAIYAQPQEVAYALFVVAKCLTSAMIPPNYLYMAELFPTSMRSAVMCTAYTFGHVGAVFASSLSLLQSAGREDLEFAVVSAQVFLCMTVLLAMPETGFATVTTAAPRAERGGAVPNILREPPGPNNETNTLMGDEPKELAHSQRNVK